jgi:copper chaperone CopZ
MPSTPRIFVGAATFRIGALVSSECARAVTREVAAVPGVVGATADLVTCLLTVTAAAPLDRSEIVAAVERAGHRVVC